MHRGVSITVENGRRIVKGLGYHEPRKVSNLKELVKNSVKKYGNAVGFKFKDKEGKIIEKTYVEFNSDIDCLGTALISLGLKDKNISIIGENRYEWGVCYLSIVNGTGIAVPLDKYLPKIEVENLIERGKVEAIFYSPAYQQIMDDLAKTNNRIKYFICMEDFVDVTYEDSRFVTLPELIEKGRTLLDAGDRSFVDAPIDENKMTVLLFTSGTTSMSKGVML
ncbi:MAG TPA: acyl--CoA ligase, partial [Clostridiaceae bacterium]|nr:acyl--CoA ligase [Clostridiaceae bacterium]